MCKMTHLIGECSAPCKAFLHRASQDNGDKDFPVDVYQNWYRLTENIFKYLLTRRYLKSNSEAMIYGLVKVRSTERIDLTNWCRRFPGMKEEVTEVSHDFLPCRPFFVSS